jgi:hypothetical protein
MRRVILLGLMRMFCVAVLPPAGKHAAIQGDARLLLQNLQRWQGTSQLYDHIIFPNPKQA